MKKKNRKILWVLPLLILPVVTLLFWIFSDGPGENFTQKSTWKSINPELPEVNTEKEFPSDKMSYYQKAKSDSVKWQEQAKNDPYYQHVPDQDADHGQGDLSKNRKLETSIASPWDMGYQDPNEEKVYQKLAKLEKILDHPDTAPSPLSSHPQTIPDGRVSPDNEDIDRLELMMQQMTSPEPEDPEIRQLNHMLETILDIQHPQRIQEKLAQASRENKGKVFPVSQMPEENPVSLLDGSDSILQGLDSGFYGLESFAWEDTLQNAIAAVIHETRTLVSGAIVKLRLTQDIYIQGVRIPKGHFVFGTANISGERLHITIDGIRYRNSLFPVELTVYGMDGIQGMHIKGTLSGKIAKESAGQTVQGIGLTSFDTSLEAQMASAGIEATRSFFSKKAKLIKVTVKAGDPVLLQDKKQKN
ncbi:conjugative transposon protein TraM [Sinomicrobium weinanense]|uniref:Conjugative transposon protein TraM n=1 Tax=Sinomicrobium weinanense TaxID=2842200 RepID=A0A926Q213_9FLAO|nr:conjugative transposon protein TraM [Sinomicrobium weinanense]MBC9795354.1 conjugative transposon protein TraM [Sinomicrobium weinanense]MBU3122931.1 conjugative transposon protein TraM [Sinomicrobium weinanense]